jgi:predicted permease
MILRQDVHFALRGFRRTPGFFATASVILMLGIGMSVAMFTVFRAVLIRRLPVVDQDHIAVMWTYRDDPNVEVTVGPKPLAVLRREGKTIRDVAAVAHWPAIGAPLLDGERTVTLNRAMATGNFFDVLGVRPVLGRLFHSSDDDASEQFDITGRTASKALVLSYEAWQAHFGGDSAVIGRRLVEPLLGWEYRVVGVAPPGFSFPSGAEYWYPMWQGWGSGVASIAVARLAPGATLAAASHEYVGIENREVPNAHFRGAHAATFSDAVLGDVRPVLATLTAAVGLLLLIACLNVGNLLLLRASGRAREIAVRRALGASYGDIVRQLLVEAAALAITGGVLGFALAVGLLRALVLVAPRHLPRLDDVQLSGAPLFAAIGISAAAVVLFGITPALLSARTNLATPLRFDARSGSETRRRRAARQVLVASQIALAMIMLGGAALLARSLARLQNQDAGYVSDHLSILSYSWNAREYEPDRKRIELSDRLLAGIEAIPGVTAATPIYTPPLIGLDIVQQRIDLEGQTKDEAEKNPALPLEIGGPDFFKTYGIRILEGRAFTDNDRESGPYVAVVSETVARRFWPGQDPIGKRIRMPADSASTPGGNAWRTVVGIARDTHLRSVRDVAPIVYFPTRQAWWQGGFAVRSSVDVHALEPALKAAGIAADPRTVLWKTRTMDQMLDEPLAQPRLSATLMSGFGLVALLLAAIGLYGVMTSLVRDQMREIGIRVALGASPGRVRLEVLRRAAIVTGTGAAIGLIGALAVSRLFASLLFEVAPTDAVSLGGSCLVLLAVGAIAAYLPARRATKIDPVQALRAD